MDYRELWREENEAVRERYDLTIERIGQIIKEETTQEPYREYFCTIHYTYGPGAPFGGERRLDESDLGRIKGMEPKILWRYSAPKL